MTIAAAVVSPTQAHLWAQAFARHLHRAVPAPADPRRVCPWDRYREALLNVWGLPMVPSPLLTTPPEVLGEDSVPLTLDHIKGWAKQVQSRLKPEVALHHCQTALAQTLGGSGWLALATPLAALNQRRAEIQARCAEAIAPAVLPVPPVRKGDWVSDRDGPCPDLAKVKDCYYDDIGKEWVADLVMFNAEGDRLGRVSRRLGGPAGFEPCVSLAYWQRIVDPVFPLTLDRTGYRGWQGDLTPLPWRNAPAPEREAAWARLRYDPLTTSDGAALDDWATRNAEARRHYGNPDDPQDWWDPSHGRPDFWDRLEGLRLRRRLANPSELAVARQVQADVDLMQMQAWGQEELDRCRREHPALTGADLRSHLKTFIEQKAWAEWAVPEQVQPAWPRVTDRWLAQWLPSKRSSVPRP